LGNKQGHLSDLQEADIEFVEWECSFQPAKPPSTGFPFDSTCEKHRTGATEGASRPSCPSEVTPNLAGDYVEACTVLPDSAKAAAALGRRCLQNLLRDTVKVKPGNLSDEIQQVLDGGKLPSGLHESIDATRNIGNFAAHPMKSTQTGMILDVEPGEAEWTLDVLEELFDFYFVRPSMIQKKRDAFNKKLQDAGKPLMK